MDEERLAEIRARQDIPDLLAEIERLQAENARLQEAEDDARTIGFTAFRLFGENRRLRAAIQAWASAGMHSHGDICREEDTRGCPRCAAKDALRATLKGDYDEMDQVTYCQTCGSQLQAVRPGKWQCPRCG